MANLRALRVLLPTATLAAAISATVGIAPATADVCPPTVPGASPVTFSDQTDAAGVNTPLTGMMGHAVAWGDVNDDGWQDLFVGTFSDRPVADYQFRGATGPSPDRLLLGGPSGFTQDTTFPEMFGRTASAAFADLDGDTDLDLVIGRNYRNKVNGTTPTMVLKNEGGQLSIATTLVTDLGARSIGVLDYDGDGRLDLFVTEDHWSGGTSILFRNDGNLQFSNATASAGLPPNIHGLGVATADLTADGHPDLVVTGSLPPSGESTVIVARLFVNNGAATFQEVGNSVFTMPTHGNEDDAAGVAAGDLNRDGWPDLVIGQHYNSTIAPQVQTAPVGIYLHQGLDGNGAPVFTDATAASGSPALPTKAPHVEIVDFDNDGFADVLASGSAETGTRPVVLHNTGVVGGVPQFVASTGLGNDQYWPTGATADYDHDGRLDVLGVEWFPQLPSPLLRNETASGHWLDVQLVGPGNGVGATVEVYCGGGLGQPTALMTTGQLTASTGFGAGSPTRLHAGLGDTTTVDVRVKLANGGPTIDRTAVAADQVLSIPIDDVLPPSAPSLFLTTPISGFDRPVHATHANDDSGRLFVVEQPGRIRIVRDGVLEPTPFLDVTSRVGCGGGLLSVAFSPSYETNGEFYFQYDEATTCNVVLARARVSTDPDVADPLSIEDVLRLPPLRANSNGHTGGQVAFGPDGFLYLAIGDGSSENDGFLTAQDPAQLWGKMLRLDVETGDPPTYTIPPSNPFVGQAGYREEIWALGYRNPWRFSFDPGTGDLFVADVGEAIWEEIDHEPAGSPGGRNYGWSRMEGTDCFQPGCDPTGLTPPVHQYGHDEGCSISGGVTYRGSQIPGLDGWFLYGDFCTGRIWGLKHAQGEWHTSLLKDTNLMVVGFGADEDGEAWVADHAGGSIYGLTDQVPPATDLSVTQVDAPDPIGKSSELTYTITARNLGTTPALDVAVADQLPTGVTFLSMSASQGFCSREGLAVSCWLDQLAGGAQATVTIRVRTPATLGTLSNTVSITGNEPDPNPVNNVSTATTTVKDLVPPSVYVNDVRVVEGDSGTTTAVFTLSLSVANPNQAVSVRAATANGTAIQPGDYTATGNQTITFAAGQTSRTVSVTVKGDTVAENHENFRLNLSNANGVTIGDSQGIATILDEEGLPVVYVDNAWVVEGVAGTTTTMAFPVTLSRAAPGTVSVKYATANGTAVTSSDYLKKSATTLSFLAGETSKTATVTVNGDNTVENNETFVINLTTPSGVVLGDTQATGTIVRDEAPAGSPPGPAVHVTNTSVLEGSSGTTTATFTVSLSSPAPAGGASVQYATANGTATQPADYAAVPATTLSFAQGETSKPVTVTIEGDTVAENNETVLLNLSAPVGVVMGDAQGVATILDEEGQPVAYVGNNWVLEGHSGTATVTFTVSLSQSPPSAVSVTYATANGTALTPDDYVSLPATVLNFAAGQTSRTVTVTVNGDTVLEPNETFLLNLSAPVGMALADTAGTGTIANDD